MLKKTITYEDFNGNEHTEDFYFNLTKAELIELQTSENSGFATFLDHILATDDSKEIMAIFKRIIQGAYGVKSADGKSFVKTQQVLDQFIYSNAYSELYTELATNTEEAVKFINGIMPKNLDRDMTELEKRQAAREE